MIEVSCDNPKCPERTGGECNWQEVVDLVQPGEPTEEFKAALNKLRE